MEGGTLRWFTFMAGVGSPVLALGAVIAAVQGMETAWVAAFCVASGAMSLAAFVLSRRAINEGEETIANERGKVLELESEVQQFRRSIDSFAEGLDVAVIVGDANAQIIYANRRFGEIFGFEQVLSRSLLEVTLSYDLEKAFKATIQDREPRSLEVNLNYPTDRVAIARCWSDPDNPGQAFLSLSEISALRRLERIRQDFVANVSHELRTPMTIIRSMAETLLDEVGDQSEMVARYLNKMISEVDRLTLISDDLLTLSDAESQTPRKHETDIAEIFRSVLQQLEPTAEEKGLTLAYEGPSSLFIQANASQMRQVALNLIDNAIKYTPTGKIHVELTAANDLATIAVTDTGIGIAEDHLPRVFERFYRVDKARSRESGGTGLGLSIVKHIIESHGGTVTVNSRLNHGSTFTVHLPMLL